MEFLDENRPDKFQHPGDVEGWKKKGDFLKRDSAFPEDHRDSMPEEAVGNSLREVETPDQDQL